MLKNVLFNIYRKLSWVYKRDLLKMLNKESGKTLDIGGDHLFKKYITSDRIEYISLNNSYDHEGTEYHCDIVADAMNMPMEDKYYDNVWCFQVLEHVNDPLALLKESHRVLKVGGKAIFSVPQTNILHAAPHNYYNFTKYGLLDLFQKAGFKEIEVKPKGGFWLTMSQRFFDYCMIWIHSLGISDLGFGYSFYENKNIIQKTVIFLSLMPAAILFIILLFFSILFRYTDISEDAPIQYVFATK